MGDTYRKNVANNGDHVLGQAQDQRTLGVVVLAATPAPDYRASVDDRVARGTVRSITEDEADPNETAPPAGSIIPTDRFGYVVFHVVFPTGEVNGSCDFILYVDGGLDAEGNPIGWLYVEQIAQTVGRKEYVRAVGQRRCFLRAISCAGISAETPAILRATGVV